MNLEELHRLFVTSTGVCTDTRTIKPGQLFFALKGPTFDANDFALEAIEKGALWSVVALDCTIDHPQLIRVADPLETLQDLARHHRNTFDIPVIALTGSNGKTTTKELISAVLNKRYQTLTTKGNLNNHIGVPLTLLGLDATYEVAVIEMGANHQREIASLAAIAMPTHGLITNFGKAHLEGFGGIQGVIKGKQELYGHLKAHKGTIFFNENDPIQVEALATYSNKVPYQVAVPGSTSGTHVVEILQESPQLALRYQGLHCSSPLFGAYNATNIAAALAIGDFFEVPLSMATQAIADYQPENMRSEVREINGYKIFLDAYNANPSSMESAIRLFDTFEWKNKALILGDMFELGESAQEEHQKIINLLHALSFDTVYLIGANFAQTSTHYQKFRTTEAFLEQFPLQLKTSNLMIKGSRGMALERVLNKLS
ncbi:MAG: hypothetical protein RLZZ242_1151 [Bacteroidota bacterium]